MFLQQEIRDVPVQDAFPPHIESVHGQDVFRVVVLDGQQGSELPFHGFFRCQKVGYLKIDPLPCSFANEIDFQIPYPPNPDNVAPTKHLHIDDVLQDPLDIALVVAIDRLPDPVIRDVVLFVHLQDLLADQIDARHPVEQECLLASPELVQHRFRCHFTAFAVLSDVFVYDLRH